VKCPVSDGAIAEERDRHAAVGPQLRRGSCADGDRQPGGHDPVGAEDAELGIRDVHGAPAGAVRPFRFRHQLGEHPQWIQAFGQAVPVAAVR
jgi:hypothetical protein